MHPREKPIRHRFGSFREAVAIATHANRDSV
jgi:hypothetical protein